MLCKNGYMVAVSYPFFNNLSDFQKYINNILIFSAVKYHCSPYINPVNIIKYTESPESLNDGK